MLYNALMLWLLFIRWRSVEVTDYWSQLAGRVNLVPFSSMGSMLRTLWHHPYPAVLWTVIYNIGGNIAMFVPLGFFLRALHRSPVLSSPAWHLPQEQPASLPYPGYKNHRF